MSTFIIPKNYRPVLTIKQTEKAIKQIKDFFQQQISTELKLYRLTAPLFLEKGKGINDDLTGVEQPVSFSIPDINGLQAEIIQSLAKWKRMMLADRKIPHGYGIYTDMNAIRPDEVLDNIHSLYVDQWDWEKVISKEERNLEFLKKTIRQIYTVLKRLEFFIYELYPDISPILPDEITFIHSEEALERYPDLTPCERETELTKEYGAIFLTGIGCDLKNGKCHDKRAPDYDDWTTETSKGCHGLNGDIILWNPVLKSALEMSSMGIRVDKEALLRQLKISGAEDRKSLYFHRRLLNDEFPLSMGGGIGQSRICMQFLRKAHIGEVQAGLWPTNMYDECSKHGIHLL